MNKRKCKKKVSLANYKVQIFDICFIFILIVIVYNIYGYLYVYKIYINI